MLRRVLQQPESKIVETLRVTRASKQSSPTIGWSISMKTGNDKKPARRSLIGLAALLLSTTQTAAAEFELVELQGGHEDTLPVAITRFIELINSD